MPSVQPPPPMVLAQVPPGVMVFGNSPGDTNDLQSLELQSGVCGVKGGDADPGRTQQREVIVLSFLSLLHLMWGLEGGEGLAHLSVAHLYSKSPLNPGVT